MSNEKYRIELSEETHELGDIESGIARGKITNLNVSTKCEGKFKNEPLSYRVEPASNGNLDECDIIILSGETVIKHYKNLFMECFHKTKIYSGEYFASIPPRYGFICRDCGLMSSEILDEKPRLNPERFHRLYRLFGYGE